MLPDIQSNASLRMKGYFLKLNRGGSSVKSFEEKPGLTFWQGTKCGFIMK